MTAIRHLFFLSILSANIIACKTPGGITWPALTINSKPAHAKIINRKPPLYGDGTNAGCVVLHEMQLDITMQEKLLLAGAVKDVSTKEPLTGATIHLFAERNKSFTISAGRHGEFALEIPAKIKRIEIESIGFRKLSVKL
jgi:hypothetical protein